jgi:ribosomal protein L29
MAKEPDRINELWSYLDEMSPEELEQRVKEIRAERRIYKTKPAKVKKASIAASERVRKAVQGMSPAELEKLMKELE